LLVALGAWYQDDIASKWEWFIHKDETTLLRIERGTKTVFGKVGRSCISPRFSTTPTPLTVESLQDYSRTTVEVTPNSFLTSGSSSTQSETVDTSTTPQFNWLHYKVIQSDSIQLLLQDLASNNAITVTDGSYHPFDETGSAAWTIESESGDEYISGISLIPGDASSQSAIRSELVGILAIYTYLHKLQTDLRLPALGGVLGCDCRSALESTFFSYRPPRVTDYHADIKASIHHYHNISSIHMQPIHIYAHQDDFVPYINLSRLEKMNVRMDYLAKQARIDYGAVLYETDPNIQLPFSFATVTVDDRIIPDNMKLTLYQHISSKQTQSYWIQKRVLTQQTAPLIYYDAIGRASTLSNLSTKIFISKWASGHLGTGKVVVRNKYRMDGSCPFCLHPQEDTTHIMDCQHDEALNNWKKHLLCLVLKMHKLHFPNGLTIAIKRELNAWRLRRNPPILSLYPEPTRSMIAAQRLIGWHQFLLGFIPISWKQHFIVILRAKGLLRRFSPEIWASKLIRATWQLLHDTWEDRCRKLHTTDLIHDFSGQQLLIKAIRNEFAIGLHNLPACDFSNLFRFSLPLLINKPLEFLKDWFVTVRTARILYNDTSLLTDKFTCDVALRRWVGLNSPVDNDSENEFSDRD
jgi:hypothetical protein